MAQRRRCAVGAFDAVGGDIAEILLELGQDSKAGVGARFHGGIRPGRVHLTQGGRVLLSGAGLDSALRGAVSLPPDQLAYVAPELRGGGPMTSSGEVFALGATLYFVMTGAVPGPGETEQRPFRLSDDIQSAAPVKLVVEALRRDPASRPTLEDIRGVCAHWIAGAAGHDAEISPLHESGSVVVPGGDRLDWEPGSYTDGFGVNAAKVADDDDYTQIGSEVDASRIYDFSGTTKTQQAELAALDQSLPKTSQERPSHEIGVIEVPDLDGEEARAAHESLRRITQPGTQVAARPSTRRGVQTGRAGGPLGRSWVRLLMRTVLWVGGTVLVLFGYQRIFGDGTSGSGGRSSLSDAKTGAQTAPGATGRDGKVRRLNTKAKFLRGPAKTPKPKPPGPAPGTLSVVTRPAGAQVWIDGTPVGKSPLSVKTEPKVHQVVLTHPGYRMLREELETIKGTALKKTLTPATMILGGTVPVKIECDTSGKYPVFIDGRDTGLLCPINEILLPPGKRVFGVYVIPENKLWISERLVRARGDRLMLVRFSY